MLPEIVDARTVPPEGQLIEMEVLRTGPHESFPHVSSLGSWGWRYLHSDYNGAPTVAVAGAIRVSLQDIGEQ